MQKIYNDEYDLHAEVMNACSGDARKNDVQNHESAKRKYIGKQTQRHNYDITRPELR